MIYALQLEKQLKFKDPKWIAPKLLCSNDTYEKFGIVAGYGYNEYKEVRSHKNGLTITGKSDGLLRYGNVTLTEVVASYCIYGYVDKQQSNNNFQGVCQVRKIFFFFFIYNTARAARLKIFSFFFLGRQWS